MYENGVPAGLFFNVGFVFDRSIGEGRRYFHTTFCSHSNALTGIVTGFLFFSLADSQRACGAAAYAIVCVPSLKNESPHPAILCGIHHLRRCSPDTEQSVELITTLLSALNRALREVLPGHVPAQAGPPRTEHQSETLRAG